MDDLKAALTALTNRKIKVDFPAINGIYVRPLPMTVNFELIANSEGETEEERDEDTNFATLAYCLVDGDDKQIYNKDEFKDFYNKADAEILSPLINAINALNDFNGKSTESKKK